MITYLPYKDDLALLIEKQCHILRQKIDNLDIDKMPFEPFYKLYYRKCHLHRPEFSLATGARLLYLGIKSTGKKHQDVTLMDYGAGLGTVYLLAKMIGVKKIIYNDLLPDFAVPARSVDEAFGIIMDEYIVGDVEYTCKELEKKNIVCDVIVSRNVIEHIYKMEDYFSLMHQYQPKAILYNSTTANHRNPMSYIQHKYLHAKYLKQWIPEKANYIRTMFPEIDEAQSTVLSTHLTTIGGDDDLRKFVGAYLKDGKLPIVPKDGTNLVDFRGIWGEHLITYDGYKKLGPQYNFEFLPGFWDIHYKKPLRKIFGVTLEFITKLLGKKGYWTSSFVYVVAKPKH
jgi:2-polyprenyl-3-methyl-5-hydroxy-6-metoxy-1,4-benzoquinol methylase